MKTIIGVIFLVFIIIIGMTVIERSNAEFYANLETSEDNTISYSVSDESTVKVTLSGEVQKPGSYVIEIGFYLCDAIALAGGTTQNADNNCFNYYLSIEEDVSIYIPPLSENEKVSLNSASIEELTTLTGVGNVIGSRILTYRNENGDFEYLEQIMNVEGIGRSIFDKIRDSICL